MSSSSYAAPRASSHSGVLDGLRLALAILVVYSHSYALLTGSDETEPLYRFTNGQLTWGGFAVDVFLILSGYLITASWMRNPSIAQFFRNRILRIYPGFAVAIALGVLVVAPLSTNASIAVNPAKWILGTLNLRGYEPDGVFPNVPFSGSMNGSVWSISYEFWCYVGTAVFGVLGWISRRKLVLLVLLAAVAISIVFVALHLRTAGGLPGVIFGDAFLWARLLPYYAAGWFFYAMRDRIPRTPSLAAAAVLALVVGAFCAPWGIAATGPIAVAYLVVFVSYRRAPRFQFVTRYGDLSYGVYLYAFPIQQLLVRFHIARTPLTLFAAATPLTLAAAMLSWHLVEKHCVVRTDARPPAAVVALDDETQLTA